MKTNFEKGIETVLSEVLNTHYTETSTITKAIINARIKTEIQKAIIERLEKGNNEKKLVSVKDIIDLF